MAIFDIKLPASIARALHLPVSDPRRQQIKVLKNYYAKQGLPSLGNAIFLMRSYSAATLVKSFNSWYLPIITIKFTMPGGTKPKTAYLMFAGRG